MLSLLLLPFRMIGWGLVLVWTFISALLAYVTLYFLFFGLLYVWLVVF